MHGKAASETAYCLLSRIVTPERFAQIVRSHWAIENSLHWCLDVIMNEDQARARMDNAPHNLAVLRHLAPNAVRKDPAKGSLRVKLKRAAGSNKIPRQAPQPVLKCDCPGIGGYMSRHPSNHAA